MVDLNQGFIGDASGDPANDSIISSLDLSTDAVGTQDDPSVDQSEEARLIITRPDVKADLEKSFVATTGQFLKF